jgi:branched-chain amino acid transport system permease protein
LNEFLQQLVNGVAWGSIYALIALGYTLVYGVLRLINFAHGDVYMVGAMAGFYFATRGAPPRPMAIFLFCLLMTLVYTVLRDRIRAHPGAPPWRAPGFLALLAAAVLGAALWKPGVAGIALGVEKTSGAVSALAGAGGAAGLFATLLAAMAICGLTGFAIERAAYRPLRSAPRLTALITAIGVSLLLENGGQFVFGADPKFFPPLFANREFASAGGVVVTNIQLLILGVSVALMIGQTLIIQRTRIGKAMRAVSYDLNTARLMGIPIDRVIGFTFVLGSTLAGAAGVLVGLSNPKIEPLMGIMPGLKAFVAAVLGGIGSVPGAMLGGILMGVAETLVVGYLSSTYRDAIAFVILILLLLFRPTGLLGRPVVEKV